MPLTFDYPLETLKTYRGINPRPADYDQYWEKALAEMHALDPQVELIPAEFQAPGVECFHLYYTGVGNARVHAQLLRPKKQPMPGPALLLFHGYAYDADDWSHKLGYVAQGFTVAALDVRGQGGLSEDRSSVSGNTLHGHFIRGLNDALSGHPEKLLYRQVFLDTAELARIVMQMPGVDPTRVSASGGSQGGALTIACAALEPRLYRAASVYPFLSDYKRVWEIDLTKDAYLELKEFFRHSDPRHEQEEAVFTALGYIDIQNLAPRIRAEVFWTTALMDTICPPSSQYAAYNKITAPKQMTHYPDFGHENLRGLDDLIFQFMTK
jgi:Acetyl esterase (deacetylase)